MPDWALSPLDISFLAIETPATPMNLGAVMIIDGAPDPDARVLADLLRERAARVPRLRRKLGSNWLPIGGASWVVDPGFDPARHVLLQSAFGGGGSAELYSWIARTLAEPLDRTRPLWELHLLAELANGGIAVLMKLHHAFLDGLGAVALAFALCDGGTDRLPGPDLQPAGPASVARALARRIVGPLAEVTDPKYLARTALHGVSTAAGVVSTMRNPGHGLPFDCTVSPMREFAGASVEMADLRLLRRLHGGSGGTANDILVGLTAGAIRSWLADHGFDVARKIRAMVPVNSARRPVSGGAGNNFSAFLLELPIDEPDPVARVRAVCEAMTHNRAIGPEGGPGAVQLLTNLLPPSVVRIGGPWLANHAARLFDILITTVPLPRPLQLGGFELTEMYPVAPLAQGQPLGIALSTYRGRGYVGITADPLAVPDPARLAAAVPAELELLLRASA
ncbi:MAG TPA: wax ester/triacylglycerol synthase family O-acyltransferase [Sporichthyaceae bacterium]|nr:wax ester/triacylglycerol synthase family O-acyltransferase [Sporichthyaceae bacterium]